MYQSQHNEPGTPLWHRTGFMHTQRYRFVGTFVRDKRILNVGCGPGYAEQILATFAPKSILSIDSNRDLISRLAAHPPATYGVPLQYVWTDAQELPTTLGEFDVIISFENIEHLPSPRRFLSALSGLRASAHTQLILSTPNAKQYSSKPGGGYRNPFHITEYDIRGLMDLLRDYITIDKMYGQFPVPCSEAHNATEIALRSLNSLCTVRIEKAIRKLIGRPVAEFSFLPCITEVLPLDPLNAEHADTFIVAGTVSPPGKMSTEEQTFPCSAQR